MRLLTYSNEVANYDIKAFSDWILRIEDGIDGEENDGETNVQIPKDFLIRDIHDPLLSIMNATYPSLLNNLYNCNYLQERVIVAPTHDITEEVNDKVLSSILVNWKAF